MPRGLWSFALVAVVVCNLGIGGSEGEKLVVLTEKLLPPRKTDCYTGCAPLRFGCKCERVCECSRGWDCSEGPSGDGSCSRYEDYEDGSASFTLSTALSRLPVSPDLSRRSRDVSDGSILCKVRPQPLSPPEGTEVLLFDRALAERFKLAALLGRGSKLLKSLFEGTEPYAHGYAGHQFSHFVPQLGDGRSIVVGEVLEHQAEEEEEVEGEHFGESGGERVRVDFEVVANGEMEERWPPRRHELSLKGSGTTPFSRGGDGRAPLSSCVRSFLGSAFLRAVGIPAEAALAVIWNPLTRTRVYRDEFYDGKLLSLPPGILARSAPTFLRFGSLQFASRHSLKSARAVASLALDRAIEHERKQNGTESALGRCFFFGPPLGGGRHCSLFRESDDGGGDHVFSCLLEACTSSLAALVAAWESVVGRNKDADGFAHGVLNTDNLSLHPDGLTVDLNVFGFATSFTPPGGPGSPPWTPNFVDSDGLYAFGERQREAAFAGLERLGLALSGALFEGEKDIEMDKGIAWLSPDTVAEILSQFRPKLDLCVGKRFRQRLGLSPNRSSRAVEAAVSGWRTWLEESGADFHAAHKKLSQAAQETITQENIDEWQAALAEASGGEMPPARETMENLAAAIKEEVEGQQRSWAPTYPTFVPRQAFLRSTTIFADASPGADAHRDVPFLLARAAAALLRHPFVGEEEGRRAATTAVLAGGSSQEQADWASDEAVRGLRASRDSSASMDNAWSQTSCGRQ